jgi:hypothetical protein
MLALRFTHRFIEHSVTLFTEAERLALIDFVSANPDTGDIVAGTGGVRKLRWGMAGQGKRGGARALYIFLRHKDALWFLDVYAKRDKSDLSPNDVTHLRAVVEAIKRAPG